MHEILWLALAIVIGGVITGLLGTFGVGGGSVIVPVLFEVFRVLGVSEDVRMQLCVGTSIAIIVPTAFRSTLRTAPKGMSIPGVNQDLVDTRNHWRCLRRGDRGLRGRRVYGFLRAHCELHCDQAPAAGDGWNLGADLPGTVLMALYEFGIGLCGSLMGVSGGAISTMVLTIYGKPIHNAVATSAGIGVPIAAAGAIGFALAGLPHQALLPPFSLGFVSLIGLIVMAPVASLVSPYGARIAHRLSRRTLEIAFGCFLLLVSLRFLVSLF